ncbi:hypothetical protein E2P81_ATG08439 [Venturia nashicola]|uniref:Uncharacterized protein n=1 Tax=Venturia nashicola TaxID=86259 RepID=A0A4Z1P1X0_9PEZI|nr:hypothetical protein E6O75_ATG08629 [Venturia nashicola]TLD21851.1 hypothetical protein E2P81_ATG08439 [Venturia nashicola]
MSLNITSSIYQNRHWTLDRLRGQEGVTVGAPWLRDIRRPCFFDYPPEIRNMIYTLALTTTTRIGLDHINGGRHIDGTDPCPYTLNELLVDPLSVREVETSIREIVRRFAQRALPTAVLEPNAVFLSFVVPSIKTLDPNRIFYQCGWYTLDSDGTTKTAWNLHPKTINGQVERRNEGSEAQLREL